VPANAPTGRLVGAKTSHTINPARGDAESTPSFEIVPV